MPNDLVRVRVLYGYAAHARFLAETDDAAPLRWIKRAINEPYAFGPTHGVYDWGGRPVIIVETRHRRYEVYEIVDGPIFNTEEEAETDAGRES